MTTKFQARFDGAKLVPLEPVDLPLNQVLEVRLLENPEGFATPQELVKLIESFPPVDRETWEAFERALEEGRTPANMRGMFDAGVFA
jgi:hypothetical protein